MNILQTTLTDSAAHPGVYKPEREAAVQNGVWGAAPSPRYDNLAAPFRPIFRRIREGATQRERNRVLPFEEIKWLKDAGFGAVRVPKEYRGRGATLPEVFALLAELAEADSNITQALRVHFAYVEDALNSQDQVRRERWFGRFADGAIIGGAWTEIGEAKMGSFSTRVGYAAFKAPASCQRRDNAVFRIVLSATEMVGAFYSRRNRRQYDPCRFWDCAK
jgi:hypothetical protein